MIFSIIYYIFMKVCVIMSTYNGERYIKEQLDSIKNQKFNGEILIYIRDDGSRDRTVEYIENYKKSNSLNININEGKNVGASKSFMIAINDCPYADYYAFCDQDDIWIDDKISTAVNDIGETNKPILWCSNYSVVDANINVLKEFSLKKPRTNDLEALFYNNVPGCVMVFNNALMKEIRKININQVRMHDIVAINIAAITGKILYSNKICVLYRQHDQNVIGYGHKKIKFNKWIFQKIKLLKKGEPYSMSEYANQIIINFNQYLDERQRDEYMLISSANENLLKRLKLLNKPYIDMKLGRTSLSIKCKLLFRLM